MSAPFTLHKYPFLFSELRTPFRVVSIDPGKVNFFMSILEESSPIFPDEACFEPIVMDSHKFEKNKHNYEFIAKYFGSFDYSDVKLIIVEKQLTMNVSIANMHKNILSYFIARFDAIIIEVNSQCKSKYLGCPTGYKGKDLKLWEVQKALELLSIDGRTKMFGKCTEDVSDYYDLDDYIGNKGVEKLNNKYKLDDGGTTIVQYVALIKWFSMGGIEKALKQRTDLF